MKNLQGMHTRLTQAGGANQQDRMINDKRKTLERAVQYSYQSAKVQLLNSDEIVMALMNPNKVLADYDEKVLSVAYNKGFVPGQVFKWLNSSLADEQQDTYWLIYLQDLTELAYFKADVRKCSYSIQWTDEMGQLQQTYATIRGPKEQNLQSIAKSQFVLDVPNYSITLLLPKNKDTLLHFQRYSKFYLNGLDNNDMPICWRVEAIDSISLPGILEVHAHEYYINDDEDNVAQGIVGGLIEPPISTEQIRKENEEIVGDNFIKPYFEYVYVAQEDGLYNWLYDSKLPLKTKVDGNQICISWEAPYNGSFKLQYGPCEKTIIVESLL